MQEHAETSYPGTLILQWDIYEKDLIYLLSNLQNVHQRIKDNDYLSQESDSFDSTTSSMAEARLSSCSATIVLDPSCITFSMSFRA